MTDKANYISVLAAGNPQGAAGFSDIAMYNNPQFVVENDAHGGISNYNPYYFSIKIEEKFTVYKLISTRVKSNGAARMGYLAIAFSVRKGYELENSNPYQVLMGLWNKFKDTYLTLKDSATRVYEYNSEYIDKKVFDETAKTYTLIPKKKVYRPMNTAGAKALIVLSSAEKIEELLKDVQYPQFSSYSEVLIAQKASDSSNYADLSQIQIPRPVSYDVWVDQRKFKTVTDRSELISFASNKDDTCYDNQKRNYTLEQLINGEGSSDGFIVDEENEQIHVSTEHWAQPKTQKIQVRFNLDDAREFFIANKKFLSITVGGSKKELDDELKFSLKGEEIRSYKENRVDVIISSSVEYRKQNFTPNHTMATLDVNVEKVQSNPDPTPGLKAAEAPCVVVKLVGNNSKIQGNDKEKADFNPGKELTVCIEVVDAEGGADKFLQTDITLQKPAEASQQHKTGKTQQNTRTQSKRSNGNTFEGHVPIPEEWKNKKISVILTTESGVIYKSDVSKNVANHSEVEFNVSNDFKKEKSRLPKFLTNLFNNKLFLLIPASLVFFIIGFLTCLGLVRYNIIEAKGSDKMQDSIACDTTINEPLPGTDPIIIIPSEEEAKAFLTEVRKTLGKEDVTFDQIIDLKIKYDVHSFEYLKQDQDGTVYKKLKDYADLVNAIQTNNIEEAKRIAARHSIPKSHAELVRMLENRQDYSKLKRFVDIKQTVTEPQPVAGESGNAKSVESGKKFTCDICGPNMYFSSKQGLDAHNKTIHHER